MQAFETENADILEGLNEEQVRGISRSYTCKDYQMIIGVPGSGKHEIVSRMLVIARRLKKKVLVMGINNQTIDKLIFRLLKHQAKQPTEEPRSRFVRVCSTSTQVHKKLRQYTNTCQRFESLKALDDFIKETDVFFATTMSVFNTFFGCFKFDLCILDEASLVTEPLSIGPVLMAEKFVMVGDYYILNP